MNGESHDVVTSDFGDRSSTSNDPAAKELNGASAPTEAPLLIADSKSQISNSTDILFPSLHGDNPSLRALSCNELGGLSPGLGDQDSAHSSELGILSANMTPSRVLPNDNNHLRMLRPEVLDVIERLGPKAVLLPIAKGQKGPKIAGWQKITIERMSDTSYLGNLNGSNIGVLLGSASDGLCAIDVDTDEGLPAFLKLNPILQTTLITKGARGGQIWVRIVGEYPKLTKLKTVDNTDFGEWRGDGGQSVIYGVHPSGKPYEYLVDAPPIEIKFDAIIWPDDLVLPWAKDAYDLLTEEHGTAYSLGKSGSFITNDVFFAAKFKTEHRVFWDPQAEVFYMYTHATGLWEKVSTDRIKLMFGEDFKKVADDTNLEEFVLMRTDAKMSSLAKTLRGITERSGAFSEKRPVIHCANGMLDLSGDGGCLKSFHPDYYSRNACPIRFDPEAQCPKFLNELLGTALDDDDIKLLQLWSGGVLLGLNLGQQALLITGTAGGGKSTVIEILERIIGVQNVAQIRTQHLDKQFEMYRYIDKRLLTGKDVGADFLSKDGARTIKALVGNDLLDAEKKNSNEQYQLRGGFNVVVTCNSKLQVKLEGDGDAWKRRLMVLEYNRPKPKVPIPDFASKLLEQEGSGILNWMIEGAIEYMAEVEEFGKIRLTDEQEARVCSLLQESDSVREFVQDRVVKSQFDVTVQELKEEYREYCTEKGWTGVTDRVFSSALKACILEKLNVSLRNDIQRGCTAKTGFKGIKIAEGN